MKQIIIALAGALFSLNGLSAQIESEGQVRLHLIATVLLNKLAEEPGYSIILGPESKSDIAELRRMTGRRDIYPESKFDEVHRTPHLYAEKYRYWDIHVQSYDSKVATVYLDRLGPGGSGDEYILRRVKDGWKVRKILRNASIQ